jgi:hypothetical protein
MGGTENREKGGSKGTVPGWNLNKSDVVWLVLPLVLTVFVASGAILYVYGRLNWHPGLLLMFHLAAIGFIVCCFVVSIVRLFIGWGKHNRKRKLLMVAEVAIPILFVVVWVLPFGKGFLYGFRDRIRSKADIPAIRAWLRTFDRSDYDEFGARVPRAKWHESLRKLKLTGGAVTVRADQKGKPQVEIIEGAAIFHWGLTIGMEDMEIPASKLKDGFAEWLLVEPGVYVYVFN